MAVQQRLTEEEIRYVLVRAEEIHLRSATTSADGAEIEAMVRAAEELGLPRTAVEQAVRERFGVEADPPKVGELAFAKSADRVFHVAKVLEVEPDKIRVRFLAGGEHVLPGADVLPCSFLPGQKVVVPWPVWGWWTCTVLSYDEKAGKIRVSDNCGSEEAFAISKMRMAVPRASRGVRGGRARVYLFLIGLGLFAGGAIGSIITWLLMR